MTTKAKAKSTLRVNARNAILNAKAQTKGWKNISAVLTAMGKGEIEIPYKAGSDEATGELLHETLVELANTKPWEESPPMTPEAEQDYIDAVKNSEERRNPNA